MSGFGDVNLRLVCSLSYSVKTRLGLYLGVHYQIMCRIQQNKTCRWTRSISSSILSGIFTCSSFFLAQFFSVLNDNVRRPHQRRRSFCMGWSRIRRIADGRYDTFASLRHGKIVWNKAASTSCAVCCPSLEGGISFANIHRELHHLPRIHTLGACAKVDDDCSVSSNWSHTDITH